MRRTKPWTITLLLLALAIFLAPGSTMAEGPHHGGGDAVEPHGEKRGEMMEKIRMMRMYALTEALELDEATAAKLFPYLRDKDREIMKLHEAKRAHRKAFRKMVKATSYDEKEVERRIAELFELDVQLAQARRDQAVGLKRILSVEQRAKFVLVSARFEDKVHGMIKEERKRRREHGERREQHGPGDDAGRRGGRP